jgi:transposase
MAPILQPHHVELPVEVKIQKPGQSHYSSGRMAALLAKPHRELSSQQANSLDGFLAFCPHARTLRSLIMRFRVMFRWRSARRLCSWIDDAVASRFQALAQFAKTLRRDRRAVELALTTPWSNGPVEGQINRLKVIKRQMYGRAGFQLLKARVLPWNHSCP